MTTPDQERQRLQCLPLHCVIEELIAAKARLEVEKSATMKCFEVIHQDRMRHVRMQATACAWFGSLKNSGNMHVCIQAMQCTTQDYHRHPTNHYTLHASH